jgi:hypothetical protein
VLVDELLVVGNDGFGNSLTDGVNLGCVPTTSNSDTDIDVGELVETNDQEGFVDLESQDLRLDEVEGLSVDLDDSFTSLLFHSVSFFSSAFIIDFRIVRTLQWATAVAVQNIVSISPFIIAIQMSSYLSSSCRSIEHSELSRP